MSEKTIFAGLKIRILPTAGVIRYPHALKGRSMYVATPYTAGKAPKALMLKRYKLAKYVTARLIADGFFAYSPIVHGHQINEVLASDPSFAFWREYDLDAIRRSACLAYVQMNGVEESDGLHEEVEFARAECKPVFRVLTNVDIEKIPPWRWITKSVKEL